MAIVECNHVSIRYMIGDFKDIGLKEFVVRKLKRNYHVVEFWADKDVTFSLEKGDMLGIIGSNGAGKSTLLKAVTGIMEPTEGYVVRRGNCAALLELASGFDGDLTVKENAFLRGAMLGYTRDFMNQKYDDIIKFAELEDFQDRPFKQLSSGMKSRLAFSIASLLAPEILILDEVLSVGDGAFRAKSEAKMREIIANGATTILVSHILSQVRSMCNKVLWLEKGHQIAFGDTKVLCSLYQMFLDKRITLDEAKESLKNLEDHYDYLIVGTGFSGAVFAHEAAKRGKKCLVVDRRRKIGGLALEWNKAGVTYQWNGRHVFHTDNEETWNYVNQFAAFRPYRHKVYAKYGDNYYPVSVDMEEVKNGCKEVMKEEAAKICERADKTECDFFSDKFQGVPEKGYTELFAELLKDCKVISGMEYKDVIHAYPDIADKIIYTGGIDAFFGYEDGRLEYRTMTFKEEVINDPTYLSKAEVINCEPGSTNNKIVEFKLITGEESEKTLVVREFPAEFVPGKECYFPVHSDYSNEIYEAYVERAKKEAPNVRFLGRLGTFRYLTMAEAVEEARKAAAELVD